MELNSTILASALAIGGLGMVLWAIPVAHRARVSRRWPTVPGRVVSRELDSHYLGRDSAYLLRVMYRYEVDGREYRNDRIGFGSRLPRFDRDATTLDAAREFPPGREVIVSYNPATPQTAVLEPGRSLAATVATLAGVLLLGAAFAVKALATG